MYNYKLEGSNGGYPLSEIPEPEPAVICELCQEECSDNFILHNDAICICQECAKQNTKTINKYLNYEQI